MGFTYGSDGKESAHNAEDTGLIPSQEDPMEKKMANPLQYSCLANSMDRGARQAIDHGVVKSWTLSLSRIE